MRRTQSTPQWGFGLSTTSSNTTDQQAHSTLERQTSWSSRSFGTNADPSTVLQPLSLNSQEGGDPRKSINKEELGNSKATSTVGDRSTSSSRVRQGELQDQHFERQSILGRGGSATVYDALHCPSSTRVALKEIGKEYIKARKHQGYDVALREEINLHRSLKHPNIVRLYSYFSTRDSVVLVMEPCLEGTLYDYLKKYGGDSSQGSQGGDDEVRLPSGLPLREVRRILRQVVNALHFLHTECGVVHRDLKLENLLMHADGQIRLADFGWARKVCDMENSNTSNCVGPTQDPSVTVQSFDRESQRLTICGTLDYMAPEIMSQLLAQHEASGDAQSCTATHQTHRPSPSRPRSTHHEPHSNQSRCSRTSSQGDWQRATIDGLSSIYEAPVENRHSHLSPAPRFSTRSSTVVESSRQPSFSAAPIPPPPRTSLNHSHNATRGSSGPVNTTQSLHQPPAPQYSPATDAWSFGCIAHELVMGLPPFYRDSRKATAYAIVQDDPGYTSHLSVSGDGEEDDAPGPSLSPWRQSSDSSRSGALPPAVVEVLHACLSKNPRDRPTMEQLLNHPLLER